MNLWRFLEILSFAVMGAAMLYIATYHPGGDERGKTVLLTIGGGFCGAAMTMWKDSGSPPPRNPNARERRTDHVDQTTKTE